MIHAHGVEAVRRAEAAAMAVLPDGALMQRAAAGLAAALAAELTTRCGGVYGRRVVLLVGPGSNGGDAMWAGARLARRGAAVGAVLTSPSPHEGGLAARRAAGGTVLDASQDTGAAADDGSLNRALELVAAADLVVDGLLGIGGRPGLREPAATLVAELPSGVPVVAVDLPSGVDPDTGELAGPAVAADLTVTFGTVKPCLLLPPGNGLAGEVAVVDIGLRADDLGEPVVSRVRTGDVASQWPVPLADDDKYSRGVVGVVAGGDAYTGAAVLAAGAAVRAGAGMVRYVGPQRATDLVRARWPEVVPGHGRVQAWVLGPGVDPGDTAQTDAVEQALAGDVPCVVDAGAIDVLALLLVTGSRPAAPLLLTPHAGELARLLGALAVTQPGTGPHDAPVGPSRAEVQARPASYARQAARLSGATVLLKGATTVLAAPDGRLRAQPDGPHWLATAGSGDVLAGLAGMLLAAGLGPLEAGGLAVAVHGRAGRVASGGGPVSATTVLDALPATVAGLLTDPSALE